MPTYFEPILQGASNSPATLNLPLTRLDSAIASVRSALTHTGAPTLTNGTTNAGATTVNVDSSAGFVPGGRIVYVLAGGALQYNQVATVPNVTSITVSTVVGAGGIADNTPVSRVTESEYRAASGINNGAGYVPMLEDAIKYGTADIYNVLAYGGGTDMATAFETAFADAHANGGGVVVIPRGTHTINRVMDPVTGNNVVVYLQGHIDASGISTGTGGVLHFDGCENVAVIGSGQLSLTHTAGAIGEAGNTRYGFYFTDCESVLVQNIRAIGGNHSQIFASNCNEVTVRDCYLKNGYYNVFIKSNTRDTHSATVENVNCENSNTAIVVQGRGGYKIDQVIVRGCRVTASEVLDVLTQGMAVDQCRKVVLDGNFLDCQGNIIMGYSVPNCENLLITNNVLLNNTRVWNNTGGSNVPGEVRNYSGVGFECDFSTHIQARNNYFYNCINGYALAGNNDFSCDDVWEAGTLTGGNGASAGYVTVRGSPCSNLHISGRAIESQNSIFTLVGSGDVTTKMVDRLYIRNLTILSTQASQIRPFRRSSTPKVGSIFVDGLNIELTNSAVIFDFAPTETGEVFMATNVFVKVTTQAANTGLWFYKATSAGTRSYFYGPIVLDGLDFGIARDLVTVPFVTMKNIHFLNMDAAELISDTSGTATNLIGEDLYLDGLVSIASIGDNSKMLRKAGTPAATSQNTRFLGQFYMDTTNHTVYVATALNSNPAADWKIIT